MSRSISDSTVIVVIGLESSFGIKFKNKKCNPNNCPLYFFFVGFKFTNERDIGELGSLLGGNAIINSHLYFLNRIL